MIKMCVPVCTNTHSITLYVCESACVCINVHIFVRVLANCTNLRLCVYVQ